MKKVKIKFAKVHKNAVIPSKRKEDAGFDIYACFDEEYIEIAPHETKLIPTGIASNCDKKYCFILKERGSTGSKGIAQRCGVIDSGYTGEWFVPLTNTTNYPLYITEYDNIGQLRHVYKDKEFDANGIIYPYTKAIAQALIVPVPEVVVETISYDELKNIKTERGAGKLGSSCK